MLKNYFLVAWRNLIRHKLFNFINILGLAVGMAACLLILRFAVFEQGYDSFHEYGDSVYRVGIESTLFDPSGEAKSAANHAGVGPTLKTDIPEVAEFCRLAPFSIMFSAMPIISRQNPDGSETPFVEENMYRTDSTFFQMFSFKLIEGNPDDILNEPGTIVLTESVAKKYFGEESAMGKTLTFLGRRQLKVTGVMEDLPERTHFDFDILLPFADFNWTDQTAGFMWKWPEFYTYIKLSPNASPESLEAKLPLHVEKYLGQIMAEFNFEANFFIQSVPAIYLHSHIMKEMKTHGSPSMIRFLFLIAGIILVIAWINYVNLSTAKATERAKEVGLRKVVGASRNSLIRQFLMETFVINAAALILALTLAQVFWPVFEGIAGKDLGGPFLATEWLQEPIFVLFLLLFLSIGPLVAGLYPAFVLSAYSPVNVLKGVLSKAGSGFSLRKMLVVVQFTASAILITGTFVVYDQLNFMRDQELGFEKDQVMVIKSPSRFDSTVLGKLNSLRAEWNSIPNLNYVSTSTQIPGITITGGDIRRADDLSGNLSTIAMIGGDVDFLDTYGLKVLYGRNFSKEFSTDKEAILLNEEGAKMLGYTNPEDALNQKVMYKSVGLDLYEGRIIGIVKNHHQRSLEHPYDPLLFFYPGEQFMGPYLSLQLNPRNLAEDLKRIEEAYAEFFPGNPFSYFFMNEFFDRQHKSQKQFGSIFAVLATLAILLACLGLLGLTTFIFLKRTKEIGIRKVLGASLNSLLVLLSKEFLSLVIVSNIIAIPVAYMLLNQWLEDYAFRIEPGVLHFLLPAVLIVLISGLSIGYRIWETARANPAGALRTE